MASEGRGIWRTGAGEQWRYEVSRMRRRAREGRAEGGGAGGCGSAAPRDLGPDVQVHGGRRLRRLQSRRGVRGDRGCPGMREMRWRVVGCLGASWGGGRGSSHAVPVDGEALHEDLVAP